MPEFRSIPSTNSFLLGNEFVNLIVGPIGSTKTSASLIKIIHEAKRVAPCHDGIRRSRIAIVRNTREQLQDTTIPDFLKWYPDGDAGIFMKTGLRFLLKLDDIECEVLFRGLDDANDVRRLLSLQLTFGMMDEFREINPDIFNALQGRLGRYPDKTMNGVGCCDDAGKPIQKVWGASNPPDFTSWWEEYLSNPPENASVTMQPSGLSPEADWLHCLPDGYYENLCLGKDDNWVDIYVHGKFGSSLAGKPVFRCFSRETHIAKDELNPLPATPLVIGVDAGLNPTAVITQTTYDGRLLTLDALTGNAEGMGALRFIREKLRPLLVNKYPNHKMTVVIDPAAFQRAQTDERSVADIFKQEGFVVKPAKTNSIAARLAAGEKFMTKTVDGKAGLLLCPKNAGGLTKALAGMYRFKTNTKGETDTKPDKNHPWSDFCFIAGTMVATPFGDTPIETLRPGDAVCVPDGIDYITAIGSAEAHRLVRVALSDGTELTCTPNHPFVLSNTCILPADALKSADTLADKGLGKWASGQWRTRESLQWFVRASSASGSLRLRLGAWLRVKVNTVQNRVTGLAADRLTALSTMVCGSPGPGRITTSGINPAINALYLCIDTCGSSTTGPSQKSITYTISTVTRPTTTSVTFSASQPQSTVESTYPNVSGQGRWTLLRLWKKLVRRLSLGIVPRKGANGTDSTPSKSPLTVNRVDSLSGGGRVYNLTTARTHVYYAGGALVHNCDAFTYACLHADGGGLFGSRLESGRREVERVSARGWT